MHAGDYVLGKILARGGFGVVYSAEHRRSGARAAVKVLHPDLIANQEVVLRFEREIEAVRRVRHPNVVEIFDCGRMADGRPFFAMELLAGVDLDEHLRMRGRLPVDEALAILEPLCGALDAAHARAIVHRDVKASNIFLSERAGSPRVVLLDFGVAKLLDAQGPSLTTSRHVLGTLACIAPEQLLDRPVDARTDVYALGALAYALLAGEPPFGIGRNLVLRQLHLYANTPRPSTMAPIGAAFDGPILRAMSKDPDARPPTAAAFLAEMQAAAAADRDAAQPTERCPRRALGVYVEALADAGALEDPDAQLLADFEAILPRALEVLARAGFSPAIEGGISALLTADRPDDPSRDEAARQRAVDAALAFHRWVESNRRGRDARVHARVCLHAGEIGGARDAAPEDDPRGELLAPATWVPATAEPGVFASPEAITGLPVAAIPRSSSDPGRRLLRLARVVAR